MAVFNLTDAPVLEGETLTLVLFPGTEGGDPQVPATLTLTITDAVGDQTVYALNPGPGELPIEGDEVNGYVVEHDMALGVSSIVGAATDNADRVKKERAEIKAWPA